MKTSMLMYHHLFSQMAFRLSHEKIIWRNGWQIVFKVKLTSKWLVTRCILSIFSCVTKLISRDKQSTTLQNHTLSTIKPSFDHKNLWPSSKWRDMRRKVAIQDVRNNQHNFLVVFFFYFFTFQVLTTKENTESKQPYWIASTSFTWKIKNENFYNSISKNIFRIMKIFFLSLFLKAHSLISI